MPIQARNLSADLLKRMLPDDPVLIEASRAALMAFAGVVNQHLDAYADAQVRKYRQAARKRARRRK